MKKLLLAITLATLCCWLLPGCYYTDVTLQNDAGKPGVPGKATDCFLAEQQLSALHQYGGWPQTCPNPGYPTIYGNWFPNRFGQGTTGYLYVYYDNTPDIPPTAPAQDEGSDEAAETCVCPEPLCNGVACDGVLVYNDVTQAHYPTHTGAAGSDMGPICWMGWSTPNSSSSTQRLSGDDRPGAIADPPDCYAHDVNDPYDWTQRTYGVTCDTNSSLIAFWGNICATEQWWLKDPPPWGNGLIPNEIDRLGPGNRMWATDDTCPCPCKESANPTPADFDCWYDEGSAVAVGASLWWEDDDLYACDYALPADKLLDVLKNSTFTPEGNVNIELTGIKVADKTVIFHTPYKMVVSPSFDKLQFEYDMFDPWWQETARQLLESGMTKFEGRLTVWVGGVELVTPYEISYVNFGWLERAASLGSKKIVRSR